MSIDFSEVGFDEIGIAFNDVVDGMLAGIEFVNETFIRNVSILGFISAITTMILFLEFLEHGITIVVNIGIPLILVAIIASWIFSPFDVVDNYDRIIFVLYPFAEFHREGDIIIIRNITGRELRINKNEYRKVAIKGNKIILIR